MKYTSLGLLVLAWMLFPAHTAAGEKETAIKVVEDVTVVRGTIDGKPVAWFNDGQLYAVYLNMKLPKSGELKQSLLATLAKNKEHGDKLLFSPFAPGDKAPELVEVAIGRGVPKEVVQALLGELDKRADLKLALSVVSEDGQGLATREVYIGGLVKSGKKAIAAEKLKSLLDPKLTQADFLEKLQKSN
jgi:hypothetical protein